MNSVFVNSIANQRDKHKELKIRIQKQFTFQNSKLLNKPNIPKSPFFRSNQQKVSNENYQEQINIHNEEQFDNKIKTDQQSQLQVQDSVKNILSQDQSKQKLTLMKFMQRTNLKSKLNQKQLYDEQQSYQNRDPFLLEKRIIQNQNRKSKSVIRQQEQQLVQNHQNISSQRILLFNQNFQSEKDLQLEDQKALKWFPEINKYQGIRNLNKTNRSHSQQRNIWQKENMNKLNQRFFQYRDVTPDQNSHYFKTVLNQNNTYNDQNSNDFNPYQSGLKLTAQGKTIFINSKRKITQLNQPLSIEERKNRQIQQKQQIIQIKSIYDSDSLKKKRQKIVNSMQQQLLNQQNGNLNISNLDSKQDSNNSQQESQLISQSHQNQEYYETSLNNRYQRQENNGKDETIQKSIRKIDEKFQQLKSNLDRYKAMTQQTKNQISLDMIHSVFEESIALSQMLSITHSKNSTKRLLKPETAESCLSVITINEDK